MLGYHIEVPARGADALMLPTSGFTHRQTLAGVVRFNAPELHEVALKVTQAGGHALAAEAAHLEELTGAALAGREGVARTADALARIDVAAALAERAAEGGWARPALVDHACFEIEVDGIRWSRRRWRRRAGASSRTTAGCPRRRGCGW